MDKNIFEIIGRAMNNPENADIMEKLRDGESIKLPIKTLIKLPDKTSVWCHLEIDLNPEDVLVSAYSNSDWAVKSEDGITVAINTNLTDDLILKGERNDLVRFIQDLRKQHQLYITEKINIELNSSYKRLIKEHADYVKNECQVNEIFFSDTDKILLH